MIDFSFVFPTENAFWTSLLILAASILFSALFNHQHLHAKIVNTQRSALDFGLFWIWLAIVQTANGTAERIPYVAAVAVIFFGYKIAGDWIGFGLRSLQFHPGGVQGWAWARLRVLAARMAAAAEHNYQNSVYSELSLYERHANQIAKRAGEPVKTPRRKQSAAAE